MARDGPERKEIVRLCVPRVRLLPPLSEELARGHEVGIPEIQRGHCHAFPRVIIQRNLRRLLDGNSCSRLESKAEGVLSVVVVVGLASCDSAGFESLLPLLRRPPPRLLPGISLVRSGRATRSGWRPAWGRRHLQRPFNF